MKRWYFPFLIFIGITIFVMWFFWGNFFLEESLSWLANEYDLTLWFGLWGTVLSLLLFWVSAGLLVKKERGDIRSLSCVAVGCLFLAVGLWIPYNPERSFLGAAFHVAFTFTAPFFVVAGFFWMLFSFLKNKETVFLPCVVYLLALGVLALGSLWYFGKINGLLEIILLFGLGFFVQSVGRRL